MKTPHYPQNVRDHFLTEEEFQLIPNEEFGYLETHPQPTPDLIGRYYESEAYLSHDDNKSGLFAAAYRAAKSINLKTKKNLLIKNQPQVKNILDIGCGTGDLLACLPKEIQKTGVEISAKAAEIARSKNLEIYPTLEEVTGQFDVISLWHVLEHLHDIPYTLNTINDLLREDGLLIIALPNYASYDAQHYMEHWAAYDVPRHLWHFTASDITKLANHHKFDVIKVLPQYLDAFYVSLLSEKYKRSKLGVLKAIFQASISNIASLFTKQASSHIYLLRKAK